MSEEEEQKSIVISYKNWKALTDLKINLKFSSIDKMLDKAIPKLRKVLEEK